MKDFLKHHVEGYVFGDLENMAKLTALPSGNGAAGYPMVATICSAIELLGLLVETTDISTWQTWYGGKHFTTYWEKHLYPNEPESKVATAIYKLVRHGLAHTAITKGYSIVVKKWDGKSHLCFDSGSDQVSLDPVRMYQDLKDSYDGSFQKFIAGDEVRIEKRVVALLDKYKGDMATHGAELRNLSPPPSTPAAPAAGHPPAVVVSPNVSVSTTLPLNMPAASGTFVPPKP
jgi:hypothetical protein